MEATLAHGHYSQVDWIILGAVLAVVVAAWLIWTMCAAARMGDRPYWRCDECGHEEDD